MDKVLIYTDGACSGNPGKGGWASILIHKEHKKEISGYNKNTTNNEMELTAVLEGLKMLKKECNVEIYSDSAYVVNAFEKGWIYNWIKNNWRTSTKELVKNKEIWQQIYELINKNKVKFIKVKGHSDNDLNNRCDELARNEIDKRKIEL